MHSITPTHDPRPQADDDAIADFVDFSELERKDDDE